MGKYNKPSPALLIDLINDTNKANPNPANVKEGELVYGPPSTTTGNWNTEMSATAVRTAPYFGSVNLRYDRLSLGELFAQILPSVDVPNAVTSVDLLATFNAKYGLAIAQDEILETQIEYDEDGLGVCTLTADPLCTTYTGEVSLLVGPDPEVGERLSEVILLTRLDGLKYPQPNTAKGQAYIYSWHVDASAIDYWVGVRVAGETITDNAFAKEYNKVVPDIWVFDADNPVPYNTADAKITYNGPTSGAEFANTKFARVMIMTLDPDLCTNFAGDLYVYYN